MDIMSGRVAGGEVRGDAAAVERLAREVMGWTDAEHVDNVPLSRRPCFVAGEDGAVIVYYGAGCGRAALAVLDAQGGG